MVADTDRRGWGVYGSQPIGPRPIQFTLRDHSGLCNQFLRLLQEAPAGRLPRKTAERILAWRVDTGSPCPDCGGEVVYARGDKSLRWSWSPSSGFIENERTAVLATTDRPKGVVLTCNRCDLEVKPWSLGGMRPRLRMAMDFGFIGIVTSLSHVQAEVRKAGGLRLGVRDDDGWYAITESGRRFLLAVDAGPMGALESIAQAVANVHQAAESVPKPEINTPGSRRNTAEASMTEGPFFRDFAAFVIAGEGLNKEEERIFHSLYGRSFAHGCEGCGLRRVLGCRMLDYLGDGASDGGCLPNLLQLVRFHRAGLLRWERYDQMVRGEEKSGFRRLVDINDRFVTDMEWTHQVDKETSLLRFVAEGAGWVDAATRITSTFSRVAANNLPVPEREQRVVADEDGSAWSISPGLAFCMGLKMEEDV